MCKGDEGVRDHEVSTGELMYIRVRNSVCVHVVSGFKCFVY